MSTSPQAPTSSEGSVEIGQPPYYHRSDCNICLHQDMTPTESAEPPLTATHSDAEAMSQKIRADLESSSGRP
jgi:hypothetical protein